MERSWRSGALEGRDHYTVGRVPGVLISRMEHPSVSRLHAVVQFRRSDAAAFVFDCHSAHGTLLNKKRIPPGTHVPLRVGDMLKFGSSSPPIFILNGPEELMPEEGLSRQQKWSCRILRVKEDRKVREEEIAKGPDGSGHSERGSWGWRRIPRRIPRAPSGAPSRGTGGATPKTTVSRTSSRRDGGQAAPPSEPRG
eukprot:jgi/Botrbrau1/20595/Bobra.113_1s0021.1